MTGILRHGRGAEAAVLSLNFSPEGNHRHADNLSLYYSDGGRTAARRPRLRRRHAGERVDRQHPEPQPGGRRRRAPALPATRQPEPAPAAAGDDVHDARGVGGRGLERRLRPVFRVPPAGGPAQGPRGPDRRRRHLPRPGRQERTITGCSASWPRATRERPASSKFQGLALPPEPPLPEFGGSIAREAIFGLRDIRENGQPAGCLAGRLGRARPELPVLVPLPGRQGRRGQRPGAGGPPTLRAPRPLSRPDQRRGRPGEHRSSASTSRALPAA